MEVPIAMGRPKALVLGYGAARTARKFSQLALSSGRAGASGQDYLLCASGKTNLEIARQLETPDVTVGLWRRRFVAHGVSLFYHELRPGRPRPISHERVAQLVRKTLKTKPKEGTHWSIRQIAGTLRSVKELVTKIDHYVQHSNRHAQQFVWTATADSTFAKVVRLCERIYGTGH